jgi:hypothetical protein
MVLLVQSFIFADIKPGNRIGSRNMSARILASEIPVIFRKRVRKDFILYVIG